MVKLGVVAEETHIDVLGVAEHWRGKKDRVRRMLGQKKTKADVEEVEDILGEEYVWIEKCRKHKIRGGVGMAIKKELGEAAVIEE